MESPVSRYRRRLWVMVFVHIGCNIPAALSAYVLEEQYVNEDFFSKWQFFDIDDPSKGRVSYVDYSTAVAENLIGYNTDERFLFMSADTSRKVQPGERGRQSLRLESLKTYNSGLFVIRVKHIPTGCGTWPAFWMYGEDADHPWPTWGEYDIIEGFNDGDMSRTALHTSQGCQQSGVRPGLDFASDFSWAMNKVADDCYVKAAGQYKNQGCSQNGVPGSFGAKLNAAGGGTWAAEWNPLHKYLKTWFWRNGTEPMNVRNGRPDPYSWGTPVSYFSLEDNVCSRSHFRNMRLVFSLDLCGDLPDANWQRDCPDLAATMSCGDYVDNHPEAFSKAFWQISTLDVYQMRDPWQEGDVSMASEVHVRSSRMPSSASMRGRAAAVGGRGGLVFLMSIGAFLLTASCAVARRKLPSNDGHNVLLAVVDEHGCPPAAD